MALRDPSPAEMKLLNLLVSRATGLDLPVDWKKTLKVSDFDDGNIDGLLLFPNGEDSGPRFFGKLASECQFLDKDGVEVIASLYLDKNENLFEIDIWKTDFSKLIDLNLKEDIGPESA